MTSKWVLAPMQDDHGGTTAPLRMHVDGWRGYAHSIARVNQWQLVALAKRPDVALTFSDAIMHFGAHRESGLFPEEPERIIGRIPPAGPGALVDVEYRITSRVDVQPTRVGAKRILTFAVTEYLGQEIDLVGAANLAELNGREDLSLVVPSRWVRDALVHRHLDSACIEVVPHGVETELFKPDRRARRRMRAELNLDRFVFLHVGAMSGNKGVGYLLEAFHRILERGIPATLVMKGNDKSFESRKWLDDAINGLTERLRAKVVENLVYVGRFMTDEEMVGLYNAADAYVSPYIAEGFNLPVLEAIACGLPVVCTAGGPTDDFTNDSFSRRIQSRLAFDDRGIGSLRPSREHLTDLMTALYHDEEFRAQAREVGPAYAHANFTWDRVVDQLVAVARAR